MSDTAQLDRLLSQGEDIANPAEIYLKTLDARQSVKSMRGALNTICELAGLPRYEAKVTPHARARNVSYQHFPWHELRAQHVTVLHQRMRDAGYASASIVKMMAALSGVLLQMRKMKLIDQDDYDAALDYETAPVKGLPLPIKRPVSEDEFRRMLAAGAADYTETQRLRNDAVLWLLYTGGFRRGELAAFREPDGTLRGFTLDQFNPTARCVTVSLKRATRTVPLEGGVLDALHAWLDVRGAAPGAVFVRVLHNAEVVVDCPMGEGRIWSVVKERAARAEPPVEHIAPHTFRRNLITKLHKQGVPLGTLQKYVGHLNPQTTMRYFYPDDEDLRDLARRMDVKPPRGEDGE